jgi:hypothetical protein
MRAASHSLMALTHAIGSMSANSTRSRAGGAPPVRTPLVVEYGTEVNGDWNPWSAPYNGGLDVGPEKFRQAYRHVVSSCAAER